MRLIAALVLLPLLVGGTPRATDDVEALGRRVYNARCYFCHGYSGDAKTLAATTLQPPPRDFTATPALTRERIVETLRRGRAGTAMTSFSGRLDTNEMQAVAEFVVRRFVQARDRNTAYHTPENGWPDHVRYATAFPFATRELAVDTPAESLTASQRAGRQLFLSSCVSCHAATGTDPAAPAWETRPLSFPRLDFAPGDHTKPVDAVSSASVYARHDAAPRIEGLTARQRRGEALFQANCAFCHGADGSGRNWIGQFMEPHARDLTQYDASTMPPRRLRTVIRDGLPGTSMPAWRTVMKPADIEAVAAFVERAYLDHR